MALPVESPECEKMLAVKDKSQTIGAFLDWMMEEGWTRKRWEMTTWEEPCMATHCDFGKVSRGHAYEEIYQQSCKACGGTGYVERSGEQWVDDRRTIEQILADYFQIDLKKVEQEKQAILDALREQH